MKTSIKSLIDFSPVVAFFGGYFLYDIIVGTAALVVALVLQILLYFALRLEVTKQMWVFALIGVIFGGITLILNDEIFIKLRPAVVSTFFVIVVLVMEFVGKKNPLKMLLGTHMQLSDQAWRGLTFIVLGCLVFNATLNTIIAFTLSNDFWVGYRMVSAFVAPCTIILLSFIYLRYSRHKVTFINPASDVDKST